MNNLLKYFITSIFATCILNASTFSDDLESFNKRTPQDQASAKESIVGAQVQSYGIVNGKYVIKFKTILQEKWSAYYGNKSRSSMVVYKDGRINGVSCQRISANRIQEDKGKSWTEHVTYECTYEDIPDGKPHEYIVAVHRRSDSSGSRCCMIWYQKLRGDAKQLKARMGQMRRVISSFEQKIAKAKEKCTQDIKEMQKKMLGATNSQIEIIKSNIIALTNHMMQGGCKVIMSDGEKISVYGLQEKILNYRYEIQKLQKQLHPKVKSIDLVKIHNDMIARIDTLTPTRELPSYFQSLGFSKPNPKNQMAIIQWRNKIKDAINKDWARTISSGNLADIQSELKKHMYILGKYDDAQKLSDNAYANMVQANQDYTNDRIMSIPGADIATDVISVIRGKDLAGNKMTALDYIFTLSPSVLTGMMRNKAVKDAIKTTASRVTSSGRGIKNQIAKSMGVVIEKVNTVSKKIGSHADIVDGLEKNAVIYFKKTQSKATQKIFESAKQKAIKDIENLRYMMKNGTKESINRAITKVYKNKTAKTIMVGSSAYEDLQEQTIKQMKKIYDDVDDKVVKSLKNNDGMEKFIKKQGRDAKLVKIKTKNITNAKKRPSLGRDRDVTFYADVKKNGKIIEVEVPHYLVEKTYKKEFYAGYNLSRKGDMKKINSFYENMEQLVTSSKHVEAYSIDKNIPLKDFFKKGSTATIKNLEDTTRTVRLKSIEFFHKAEDYKEKIAKLSDKKQIKALQIRRIQEKAEGMRQASKQYKNMIEPRAKKYLKSTKNIPLEIRKSMEIYEKAGAGLISPDQADIMIKRMFNKNADETVEAMANYLYRVEGELSKTYRAGKKEFLSRVLHTNAEVPSFKAFTDSLSIISNALKKGDIYVDDFHKLRKSYLKNWKSHAEKLSSNEQNYLNDAIKTWTKNVAYKNNIITEKEMKIFSKGIL